MHVLVDNKQFLRKLSKVTTYLGEEVRDLEFMALLGSTIPSRRNGLSRLEQLFEANDLNGDAKADKRRATFLSVIAPTPYKLLSIEKPPRSCEAKREVR